MPNDTSNDDLPDRTTDEQPKNRQRPPGREPGDTSRERFAWALFALLSGYIGLHPFLPKFGPDPAIVGAIITGIVSLLATRAFQGVQ